jgi:hypothetical protein
MNIASFSHVQVGAGPRRIHPKTPSGQPQKRCTFAFQCFLHALIAELHLAFQPFVKFPDSCNSAFKALSEGAGDPHLLRRCRYRRHYPQHQCLPLGASLCLEGIWMVLVLSDVMFRG